MSSPNMLHDATLQHEGDGASRKRLKQVIPLKQSLSSKGSSSSNSNTSRDHSRNTNMNNTKDKQPGDKRPAVIHPEMLGNGPKLSTAIFLQIIGREFQKGLLGLEGGIKMSTAAENLNQLTIAAGLAEIRTRTGGSIGAKVLEGRAKDAMDLTSTLLQEIEELHRIQEDRKKRAHADKIMRGTHKIGLQTEEEALTVGLWHYWVGSDAAPSSVSMRVIKLVGFILWLRYRNIVGVMLSLDVWLESARRLEAPTAGLAASVLHETCRYYQEKQQLHLPVAQGFVTLYDAIRFVTESQAETKESI